MNLFERFENVCKAKAYDASLKHIERKIRELENTEDAEVVAGLKFAKTILKTQLRFIRYTQQK